jgi:hypothetical protein
MWLPKQPSAGLALYCGVARFLAPGANIRKNYELLKKSQLFY